MAKQTTRQQPVTVKLTVEVPDSFGFVRQKTPFNVPSVKALAPHILSNLLMHGIVQKVGDSAAGTEPGKEATDAMQKTWEQLLAGDWKTVGVGVDPVVAIVRTLTRTLIQSAPAFAKQLATYKAIASDDQARRAEYLDKVFDALPDDMRADLTKRAEAKIAAKTKERSGIAALSAGRDLKLDI